MTTNRFYAVPQVPPPRKRRPMADEVVYPTSIIVAGERIPGKRRPWLKRGPGMVKRHGCWWWAGCEPGRPMWIDHQYRWRATNGHEFFISEPYSLGRHGAAQLAQIEAAGWRVLIDDRSMHGFSTMRVVVWQEEARRR